MKRLKFYISMLLTACLALPAPLEAAGSKVETEGQISSIDRAGKKAEYAKGEAIILYREKSASTYSAMETNGLESDMQIEETYEFEDLDADIPARSKSKSLKNNTISDASQTLKVSLVKSDIYSTKELVKKLSARKDVLAAEPNYRIHALNMEQDPYVKYQWAIDNQGQNNGIAGFDVNPEQEILETGTEGDECVIALVDTGIDYTHEDLKNVVWNNPVQSNKLKGAHGYDFINYDTDPMDDNGHGSHCSGIMAAEWGNGGIRGVVNNPNVKIMALKILDEDGSGYEMEAVGAYNYIYKAQQLGINVVAINNSWGGADEEESVILETLMDLVGGKGAVSVCAAGNDGSNNDVIVDYPAGSESKYVISVAASNENDELAAFSNYGKESVDIAAPGANILSTVSYDCFNPGIYEDTDKLCSMFKDFSSGNLVQGDVTGDDGIAYGYVKNNGKAKLSLALSNEAYFGPRSNAEKSLKWSIKDAKAGDIYTLYFPYTAGVSSTATYDSIMVKAVAAENSNYGEDEAFLDFFSSAVFVNDVEMTEEGTVASLGDEMDILFDCIGGTDIDKGNYWTHISGLASEKRDEAEKRALAVSLTVSADGDFEIYLDNLGISKENVPSEQFGKYDYYNGTSMATPHVTGAVAAIASAYREEDALDRIVHVMGCTRKSDALKDMVSSGGVLDLSRVEIPNTYIRGISLDAKQNIKIEGRHLEDAVVSVNSQTVTPKAKSNNEILLDSSGLLNRTLNITVASGEKVMNKECFLTSGAGFGSIGRAWGTITDGTAVSDGEQIYYVDGGGTVSTCMPDQKDELESLLWFEGGYTYTPELFGMDNDLVVDYDITNISDIICLDGKLWTVLKMDLSYSEEKVLACYSEAEGWKAASKLPEKFENLEEMSIAAHQGKLYLLGGLDVISGKMRTDVMQMDTQTKKWENAAPLPEARAFAKAVSIGDKLIVTLGGNEEGGLPHNLIFNGKSWSVSKAEPGKAVGSNRYFWYKDDTEYQEIPYYSCYVGSVKDGLVYAGLCVETMGDTFFYQASSDKYVIADYSMLNTKITDEEEAKAVVMQDKFYLLVKEKEEVCVYAMPVQSSCIEAAAKNVEDGYVEGGQLKGIRHYMPGDVVHIEAVPEEGYFVKRLTVDGKNVAKGKDGKYVYRTAANEPGKKYTASIEFGEYVLSIIMEESLELYAGQTYQMEAYVVPDTAENLKLNWSSSNTDVAAVDKNGTITVSKKAKKGSTAVITATAADRNQIKASCTVTVSTAPLPWINEIAYSGKLAYKVTKSSSKQKTVTCTGFENKEVKSVKIPDTIMINGYTYKVTGISKNAFAKSKKLKSVTIGKNVTYIENNAFANCTALTSIQIKGTSIKAIGKNALKGINKKAVVKVPKKQKKTYTAKLKKSGYSGKIK